MAYKIERDGFFFRAVDADTGSRSQLFTSASQAGGYIGKVAGKDAHAAAADDFCLAQMTAHLVPGEAAYD